MSPRRPMPCDIEPECLADLLADARAIPPAAFARRIPVLMRVIDLTGLPQQRCGMQIPDATVSLVEAAEAQLAGYRR